MNEVFNLCDALARLVETTEKAIESGDWKVDGACDPDADLERARYVLRRNGWTQNSIDGSWMPDLG